jgi:hypothetical protein
MIMSKCTLEKVDYIKMQFAVFIKVEITRDYYSCIGRRGGSSTFPRIKCQFLYVR